MKISPFSHWISYPKKIGERLQRPLCAGRFTEEDAKARGMRLCVGREGEIPSCVILYLLVDPSDGVIADAKFQAFGSPHLIALADLTSELLLRKNYDQAKRISGDLIHKQLGETSLPFAAEINLIIDAIDAAASQCVDIPFADTYNYSPISSPELPPSGTGYPGWPLLPHDQKLALIEEVIANDIRPYVELDEGGVTIHALASDDEVVISYQGSCTTCHSSTGSTLTAIQQILRAKLNPRMTVTPKL
jgi:NifU-like protein